MQTTYKFKPRKQFKEFFYCQNSYRQVFDVTTISATKQFKETDTSGYFLVFPFPKLNDQYTLDNLLI